MSLVKKKATAFLNASIGPSWISSSLSFDSTAETVSGIEGVLNIAKNTTPMIATAINTLKTSVLVL